MKREQVYEAIDTERAFQDFKWGSIDEHPHEVGAWLTILHGLIHKAQIAWSESNGDVRALQYIRKIAGVAVACSEQHGIKRRSPIEYKDRMRDNMRDIKP
jgi:hypothetical protein